MFCCVWVLGPLNSFIQLHHLFIHLLMFLQCAWPCAEPGVTDRNNAQFLSLGNQSGGRDGRNRYFTIWPGKLNYRSTLKRGLGWRLKGEGDQDILACPGLLPCEEEWNVPQEQWKAGWAQSVEGFVRQKKEFKRHSVSNRELAEILSRGVTRSAFY